MGAEDFAHGRSAYIRHRCRCPVCTAANTAAKQRQAQQPIRSDRHGTVLNYLRGCRCAACYAKVSQANRKSWERRKQLGIPS